MSATPHRAGSTPDGPSQAPPAANAAPAPAADRGPCAGNGEPLRAKVVVCNPQGFHMRPQSVFAELARQYQSAVTVCKESLRVNGKSLMELMLLGAEQGTELTIEVQGSDAPDALKALAALMAAPSVDPPADPAPPGG